ncbi:MAG: adenylyl-sulfate kinase [Chitinophagaceae bacterium]
MNNSDTLLPCVIFLTGLSGAGKTTLARQLNQRLHQEGHQPVVLDGDEIREVMRVTGFDEASRKNHNLSVGALAALLERQGHMVIVALIAPYNEIRSQVRAMCRRFMEVYLSTDIKTCMERDTKGLYKKAIAGEIKEFTGISAPYEPPQHPELVFDTAAITVEECAATIIRYLKTRLNDRSMPANP